MIVNPRTPVERLLWAYQFGHSWNRDPKYANLRNLDSGRILLMNGDESDAKLLLASWQDFDPNVARLVAAFHKRSLEPNGEWGPASEAVSRFARCAMPDFAPPKGAELSVDTYDVPELLGAVESYQRYADYKNDGKEYSGTDGSWDKTAEKVEARVGNAAYVGGSGSWPGPKAGGGCDPEHKDIHSVRMNVVLSGFSSHQRAQWPTVAPEMSRCSAEVGLHTRFVFDGTPSAAEHDVRGQFIAGGVIGFAYFNDPDSCQKGLVARIDNSFDVDDMTFTELNEHEEGGHSRGLEHANRQSSEAGEEGYSIMHPSIGRPKRMPSWLKDRHFPTMKKFFGGVAIPGPTPPAPPTIPPTIPGDPWAGSSVTVQLPGKPPRRFVPALEV